MEIKPGVTFKYQGGVFTIGEIYPELGEGVLYVKDQNEYISEVKIATAKKMIEDGLWKKSIFKSEDGKRIFDGDPYWWIRNSESINEGKAYLGMVFNPPPNHRRYSTKEAAEQALKAEKEGIAIDTPRRIHLNRNTNAELAIHNAMQEVEKVGADVKLTKAVILLQQAKNLVADYVDSADKN